MLQMLNLTYIFHIYCFLDLKVMRLVLAILYKSLSEEIQALDK